jgi:peptidoglycan/LPS O-acetylase OafA/YrhL
MMTVVVMAYVLIASRSKGIHLLPGGEFDDLNHWVLYLSVAAILPLVFLCTRSIGIDSSIGELSYPIYLVHLLVLEQGIKPIANAGISPIYLLLLWTVVLAWFLVKAVEQPMDRIRARLSGKEFPRMPVWPGLRVAAVLPRLAQAVSLHRVKHLLVRSGTSPVRK